VEQSPSTAGRQAGSRPADRLAGRQQEVYYMNRRTPRRTGKRAAGSRRQESAGRLAGRLADWQTGKQQTGRQTGRQAAGFLYCMNRRTPRRRRARGQQAADGKKAQADWLAHWQTGRLAD
jgi:hypothetical protein